MFRGITSLFLVISLAGYFAVQGMKSESSRAADSAVASFSSLELGTELGAEVSAALPHGLPSAAPGGCQAGIQLQVQLPAGFEQANIRSTPSFSASVVGQLPAGSSVTSCRSVVISSGAVNKWHLVSQPGSSTPLGWVHHDVLGG